MKVSLVLLAVAAAVVTGCKEAPPPAPPPAAKVENPVKEAELTKVTLSADAERRLGLVTAPVESRALPETRVLGGIVVTPPGRSFPLTAPVAGTVLAPPGGMPRPGVRVTRGQVLLRLVPLPPDPLRVDEDVALAESRARQAEQEAARIEELARDSLVSRRELERAQAELAAARTTLAAARGRLQRQRTGVSSESPGLTPLAVASPDEGVVLDLSVGAGQVVAAGAPMITVARMDRLWVKVAIFSGDAATLDPAGEVAVDNLQGEGGQRLLRARRALAPPSADPLSASVDEYFELPPGTRLRPGQRVDVSVPLRGSTAAPRLVVPLGALVYDLSGGTWVYVKEGERTYVRRRVALDGIVGQWAVLSRGPAAGAPVVVVGAAELFGTEFGAGK
jgi:membrane fusion protein, heavy metal efflux system